MADLRLVDGRLCVWQYWSGEGVLYRKYCWTVTSRLSLRRCASISGVEVLRPKRLIMQSRTSVHSIPSPYHSSAMPLILNKKSRMRSASGRLCVSTSNRVSHVCTLMSLLIHRTNRVWEARRPGLIAMLIPRTTAESSLTWFGIACVRHVCQVSVRFCIGFCVSVRRTAVRSGRLCFCILSSCEIIQRLVKPWGLDVCLRFYSLIYH